MREPPSSPHSSNSLFPLRAAAVFTSRGRWERQRQTNSWKKELRLTHRKRSELVRSQIYSGNLIPSYCQGLFKKLFLIAPCYQGRRLLRRTGSERDEPEQYQVVRMLRSTKLLTGGSLFKLPTLFSPTISWMHRRISWGARGKRKQNFSGFWRSPARFGPDFCEQKIKSFVGFKRCNFSYYLN